jgi:hypothetical protein
VARRALEAGLRSIEATRATGVGRRTVCKWLRRFRQKGPAGLQNRSSRPRRCPRRISAERVSQAIGRRRQTCRQVALVLNPGQSTVARLAICCALLLASIGAVAQSADCALDDYRPSVRPDASGTPTIIKIGVLIADVISINDVDQSVVLDALLTTEWTDPRLEQLAGCRFPDGALWTPRLQLINAGNLAPRKPPELVVDEGGVVKSMVRYSGSILSPWHMADFPFDSTILRIRLTSLDYRASELSFTVAETISGRRSQLTVPDWNVGEPAAQIGTLPTPRADGDLPIYELQIPASRIADYYIFKFVIPLCLIVMMSWSVFWVDPDNLGPQLSLSATTVLTLIAYQFSINELLPKIGYFTAMDYYMLASSILVFLALVEALTTGALAAGGRHATARLLDRSSRWVFPAGYVTVILVTLVF